jgi:membrane fusion protein, multidrug efflux system
MKMTTMKFFSRAARAALVMACTASVAACGNEGEAAQAGRAGGPPGGGGGPGGPGGGGMRMPVVETAAVGLGSIAREVVVPGTVQPIRTLAVNAQASGALLAVNVEEGSRVSAGQVLARVDAREVEAQVRSAEAQYRVTRAARDRAEQLRDRQVITVAEYERDRAAYDAARSQLDQLRTRLGYAVIRAPAAGVVTAKHVETGDIVSPQARLFEIADVSTLVVPVRVSELDVVHLAAGDEARITLDAYPDRPLTGRIRRIFPAADPGTRLVPVEVALTGGSADVARPGFLARVSLALGTRDGVRLVPGGAVVGAAGAQAVYVVTDGTVERRPVQTGLTSQGQVEIVSGVEEGEPVVVVGNHNLRDGATVRVVGGPGGGERGGPPARGGGR